MITTHKQLTIIAITITQIIISSGRKRSMMLNLITIKQIRTITTQPSNGGITCPSLTQQINCSGPPCPVDCVVSNWQNSGQCSTIFNDVIASSIM